MGYLTCYPPPLAIAHRGGASEVPENTMEAFSYAVDLGYQFIETDVRMARDGTLFLFHDKEVERLTGGSGKLSEMSEAEISKLRIKGHPIPRAADALKAWPDVCWNIDPKISACVRPLAKLIDNLGMVDRVCIGSFLGTRQKLAKKLLGSRLAVSSPPSHILGVRLFSRFMTAASAESGKAFNHATPLKSKYSCLQIPLRYKGISVFDKKFLAKAHQLGLQVHIWTVDDPSIMGDLIDMGVDGIMTDSPRVLKEVLIHRKLWNSVDKFVNNKNF